MLLKRLSATLPAMGILLLSIAAGDARGGVQYTVTDLGTLPGGGNNGACGINSTGQVVGVAEYDASGNGHAFLYSNGTMTDLGTLPGGFASYATGINAAGQVVGGAGAANWVHPFLYGGTMTDLGFYGDAKAINASAQVVGWAATATPGDEHAFLYSAGRINDLGTLGGSTSCAAGINDAGQVVGWAQIAGSGHTHAFLYSGGSMTDLGTLPGGLTSNAKGINAAGQVVGAASVVGGYGHAFLWQSGTGMQDLGTLGGSTSYATGINASGQVVGWSDTSSGGAPFVYYDGVMSDLSTLIWPTSDWTRVTANAINDSGWIVGSGTNAAGQVHSLLLTPVTEPSPLIVWSLLGASGVGIGWWRRRRRTGQAADRRPADES